MAFDTINDVMQKKLNKLVDWAQLVPAHSRGLYLHNEEPKKVVWQLNQEDCIHLYYTDEHSWVYAIYKNNLLHNEYIPAYANLEEECYYLNDIEISPEEWRLIKLFNDYKPKEKQ